jgi:hypothetical protein
MAQQRKSPAKSMYPHLPSSADDLASTRRVQGEVGSGASRIWKNLASESRRSPEPPAWGQGMWFPKSAPHAMKKRGR